MEGDNNDDFDFDDVLLLEETYLEETKNKSYEVGFKAGYIEGYVFGLDKSIEIANEIGEYHGNIISWLILCKDPNVGGYDFKTSNRIEKVLIKCYNLIINMSYDPADDDFDKNITEIRMVYKQIKSLLKINEEKKAKQNLNSDGLNF
eukprot:TRINITY_DN2983_c0_g2_i3.p1 TRINITY_DN2983_c0_g2~~TRINITY_DN2983_c0_g2_i3.p1  ORF type:complete len:147 (+),score=38.12 TRINITY_DN2983_c0_g2_i3:58-498(+)